MARYQLSMLLTDWCVWILFFGAVIFMLYVRTKPHLRDPWRQVFHKKMGMAALVVLLFFGAVGLSDSIHFQVTQYNNKSQITSIKIESLFDIMVRPLGQESEKTYSAPFATYSFTQTLATTPDGQQIRGYAPLQYVDQIAAGQSKDWEIANPALRGLMHGMISFIILANLLIFILAKRHGFSVLGYLKLILAGKTYVAWREALITFGIMWTLVWVLANLAMHYHILGTDKIGTDVFYATLKSIRTGLLIGTLTTLFMLPFALILGTLAGYFRGWIDDLIQYLYTTLSSIPGVLLISASVLVMQVYISTHEQLFPSLASRADARLLALCVILGITSWASLCRLLRAETLKLRGHEYIQAARSLGVSSRRIIWRHILPNVMHIVLITIVLDFSGLVLAEAVLSYVGVGVDPTTFSWGNMINSSRLELAREPMVWWPLIASFMFMFTLVLAANLFADSVRDAFDPRLRKILDE